MYDRADLDGSHWTSLDGPPLPEEEQSIALLLAQWEKSSFLRLPHGHPQRRKMTQDVAAAAAVGRIAPPHLENCEQQANVYHKLDSRGRNGRRPAWSLWKAQLGDVPKLGAAAGHELELDDGEHLVGNSMGLRWGPFPPWIDGSDQDNLPFTRRVQRDVWLLQHPRNCSAHGVRFLLVDWQNRNRLGLGAEINRMAGMLGLAVTQRRVLVFGDFNRADHKACRGKHRRRWSCYFAPESTDECRQL